MPSLAEINLGPQERFLLAYDRSATTVTCWRWNQGSWQHHPELERAMPPIYDWVRVADWNGDGKPDIFTQSEAVQTGMAVYTYVAQAGAAPQWQLATDTIHYNAGALRRQLLHNPADIPAIDDFDGDGDADILYAPFGGLTFSLLKNMAVEEGRPRYLELTACAGNVASTVTCGSYNQATCRAGVAGPMDVPAAPLHLGAALTYADLDGDGQRDMVHGDIGCYNAYYFRNLGTTMAPSFAATPTSQPSAFSHPLYKISFPGLYQVDTDQDGQQDWLLTSTEANYIEHPVDTRNSVTRFRRVGASWQFQEDNWLQNQMLDLGVNATPCFADIDADGDLDLLVGYLGQRVQPGEYFASVALFRNVGSPQQASFVLEQEDYLGLSSLQLINFRPAWGDVTQDGVPDLVLVASRFSNGQGLLLVVPNRAPVGQPAQLDFPARFSVAVNGLLAESPAIVDADGDGDNDILIGRFNGTLLLLQNRGTAGTFAYTAVPDAGRINSSGSFFATKLATADLDRDGLPDLVLADQAGKLFWYPDLRSWILSQAPAAQQLWHQKPGETTRQPLGNMSTAASPALADLDGDQFPDLLVGSTAGGLRLLRNVTSLVFAPKPWTVTATWTLSPNPTSSQVMVSTLAPLIDATTLPQPRMYTSLGQELPLTVTRNGAGYLLEVSELASGLYFVQWLGQRRRLIKQ